MVRRKWAIEGYLRKRSRMEEWLSERGITNAKRLRVLPLKELFILEVAKEIQDGN